MSVSEPAMRTGRPASSRTAMPRHSTQRISPRTWRTRYSCSKCARSPSQVGAKRFDQPRTIFFVRVVQPLLVRRDLGRRPTARSSASSGPSSRACWPECPSPTDRRSSRRPPAHSAARIGGRLRARRPCRRAGAALLPCGASPRRSGPRTCDTSGRSDRPARPRAAAATTGSSSHSADARRRGTGADEVARRGPQEVRLPDTSRRG